MHDKTKHESASPVLEAALAYAKDGFAIRGLGEKRRLFIFAADVPNKKGFKSAEFSNGAKWGQTNSENQIRIDFRQFPDAGIGIPTGEVNGFFVVEVDTKAGHGVDGIASLGMLQEKHGELPDAQGEIPDGKSAFLFQVAR